MTQDERVARVLGWEKQQEEYYPGCTGDPDPDTKFYRDVWVRGDRKIYALQLPDSKDPAVVLEVRRLAIEKDAMSYGMRLMACLDCRTTDDRNWLALFATPEQMLEAALRVLEGGEADVAVQDLRGGG